eukprot:CAMPEP_0184680774 /NCGR_PEP_ID=MMETSP0312-20130426/3689_1 /TAXON_ID=31354 /ORGANISM="Compsopogon coeruleus, Strain SAG 36.94" /LENGTH=45 /DNA_ID= /DNA_START= /DNA_END= /DNA_ORIENTATION=
MNTCVGSQDVILQSIRREPGPKREAVLIINEYGLLLSLNGSVRNT